MNYEVIVYHASEPIAPGNGLVMFTTPASAMPSNVKDVLGLHAGMVVVLRVATTTPIDQAAFEEEQRAEFPAVLDYLRKIVVRGDLH